MFRFTAQGRIGRIDELKNNTLRISLAADRLVEGNDGQWTKTEWLSFVSFDAELNKQMLTDLEKGQSVTLEGRIVPRTREVEGRRLYDQSFEITRVQRGARAKPQRTFPIAISQHAPIGARSPLMPSANQHPRRSAHEIAQHVTAEIARLLERGVMPWRAPWDAVRAAAATPGLPLRVTGEPYRGANVVLLWASQITRGYARRTWLTYRNAEALRAHVRKGEKATPVVFYGQAKAKDEAARTDADEAKAGYRFLKLFHVFNIEQLDEIPETLPAEPILTPTPPCRIEAWAKRAEARVRIGGASAYYAPATDTIHLPHASVFCSDEHRIATLCHELAHHTGAAHRLSRLKDYFTDRQARAREELIAELASATLGAMIGLSPDHLEDHAAYVSDWLRLLKQDPRAFLSAAAKAQTAVDWLIDKAGDPAQL
jgi:antirestriction protein ArdC